MFQKLSPKTISLTFSILVICFAVGFYAFAWTEPTQPPPDGNVNAPVNVGSTSQAKEGWLTIGDTTIPSHQLLIKSSSGNAEINIQSGISPYWAIYQDDITDDLRFWSDWDDKNKVVFTKDGRLIIGTITPDDPSKEYELWVEGDIRVTGGFNFGSSSMTYDPIADKLTVDAEIATDKFTVREVCLTGDICRITWPAGAGGGCEDVIKTFSADSGSKTASGCTDTLTIAGGTGIATAILGSTLTITNTATFTEQDTLDTVSDRGRSTNQSIITGGLELDGSGSEGNISEANIISGYSDLHLRATLGGTHAAIYLDDDREELEF